MYQLPVIQQPQGAPNCWGEKYQDGDLECGQCRFNDSCKKEVLRGAMNAPYPAQQPAYPPQSVVPFPRPPVQQPFTVPTPYRPPIPTASPVPMSPVTQYQQARPMPVTVPQPYQSPVPFQPYPQQFSPPQHNFTSQLPLEVPDPMVPWVRPGSSAPPYFFTQYPGEAMGERLMKNILMAIGAAIAGQLVHLFTQWTWPPRRGNNNSQD